MGRRVTSSIVESTDNTKSFNRIYSLLPCVWLRGNHSCGYRIRLTSPCPLHRGRSQGSSRRRRRSERRSLPASFVQIGNISTEAASLPQQEDPPLSFREGDLVLRRIQK